MTRRLRGAWPATLLVAALLAAPAARAEDDKDELTEETVSGKRVGGLDTSRIQVVEGYALSNDSAGAMYSERVVRGARVLKTSQEFVHDCVVAIEHLYHRRYTEARNAFAAISVRFPDSAAEPVGQVLVWQALMLENFDYKYVTQYELASKRARMQLEAALYQPGNEPWEHFMMAGVLGIDSIHTMRRGDYLKALNRGIEAMKSVAKAQEHAPEFVDAWLGDGMFNYWRSVIAMSSRAIPDMGDHRAKGIEQMQRVEREGIFLSPASTLALVFTWMEEGDMTKALAHTSKNQRLYPENVVNNLVHGRVLMYMKRYDESERAFLAVLKQEPKNERVHYYLSRLYMRKRDLPHALGSINRYLAFSLDDETRGYALYTKGLIELRLKNLAGAEQAFAESYRLAKLDQARTRLESVRKARAAGG
ncbi:tetratricopeptide repeat protein [Myxococcota bacterium]|nr:tetratricopeptide repeat protein [Myxococcota bacterium]